MFGPEEIENLAEAADHEQEEAVKFSHNYSLKHTHSANGIKLERMHSGTGNGLLNKAATKIASLLEH